jgi:F0F1-type ATP synthase membrane subunit c/vacuolar-type H+-ATPase subunit K
MTYAPRSASELDTYKRVIVVLYFALLATVPMYGIVAEVIAANRDATDPGVIKLVLLAVGAGTAAVVLFIRFSLIPPILHTPTMALRERLGRLRAFYIICFALSEAVALYGLVLRIMGAGLDDSILFFAVSIGLFLLCYPKTPQTMTSGPTH